jgi:hypothetical protein
MTILTVCATGASVGALCSALSMFISARMRLLLARQFPAWTVGKGTTHIRSRSA